jgi:hypothetical protein
MTSSGHTLLVQLPLERRARVLAVVILRTDHFAAVRRAHARTWLRLFRSRRSRRQLVRVFAVRVLRWYGMLTDQVTERADLIDDEVSHPVRRVFSLEGKVEWLRVRTRIEM